jgi:ribosomal protein S18 acetylase RimI-like enzyme
MQTITRPAIAEELPILLQFEQGVIEFERAFDPTLKEKDASYYDLAELIRSDQAEVLVVEVDGKIVASGYAQIRKANDYLRHQQYAYMGFMYVLPEYRGQGLNALIMDGLISWGNQKGITEFRLDVYAQNTGAIRAYEKKGFISHLVEMRMNTAINQDYLT